MNLTFWMLVGFAGQATFSGRFIAQWISSERKRRSTVPETFWYFSIAGGAMLLAYAIHQRDLVFILGQSLGLAIYARNIQLIRRSERPAGGG
ncbi:lipid-A-disaccharide synthase N-terminal domain-containing protein [Ancylobacter terrae]|uniref:lipid-A-disaccharide synthase N-terminal domain-containing protein n=1 Tax=Ancylobacter sp. sgz301288 TaxID=3342077 RepID=UPI00385D3B20